MNRLQRYKYYFLLSINLLLLFFLYDWYSFWHTPIIKNGHPLKISVHPGQHLRSIMSAIQKSIPLSRPSYFHEAFIRTISTIHSGRYSLTASMTPTDFLYKLKKGDTDLETFRIKEGSKWSDLYAALNKNEDLTHTLTSPNALQAFAQRLDSPTLEGVFAPDTYFFKKGINDQELLIMAAIEQKKRVARLHSDKSFLDILTLASIIEKEGNDLSQYKMISGILQNRLTAGKRLQSDATVRYGLKNQPLKISQNELWIMHPHNTYRFKGLPPTPIAYPSEHAMIAAVYPEKTDFFFFLTDRQGTLKCSKDFKEHVDAKKNL